MKINQIIEQSIVEFDDDKDAENLTGEITTSDIEKIFFGNLKMSPESDTAVEKELFRRIDRFIGSGSEFTKDRLTFALKKLMPLKSKYPDDLMPKAKIAYRATLVDDSIYASVKNNGVKNKSGFLEVTYHYKPQSELQSWTTDFDVALKFAQKYMPQVYNPVILETSVDDNFIMNSKITNMIIDRYHKGRYDRESEIFRISKAPMNVLLMVWPSWVK